MIPAKSNLTLLFRPLNKDRYNMIQSEVIMDDLFM